MPKRASEASLGTMDKLQKKASGPPWPIHLFLRFLGRRYNWRYANLVVTTDGAQS